MKKLVLDFTREELEKEFSRRDMPRYRARQVFLGVMRKGITVFKDIPGLPRKLADELEKEFTISPLKLVEKLASHQSGTEKFLWELQDGNLIETVFIGEATRKTLCLSSQVGCKFGCPFCASGKKGFIRDLTVAEMTGQLLAVQGIKKERLTNVVFMGMGEPLDNYDNVAKAIRIINHPDGISLGARKITVSTCGVVPGIMRLKSLGLQVELSVSLHAASDKVRDELAPVNKKYPIKKLINACREYTEATRRVITLEYMLIKGKNDSTDDAKALGKIARSIKAKVNLIACNIIGGVDTVSISRQEMNIFKNKAREQGVNVTVRESKGQDIFAACGQLAANVQSAERKEQSA